VHFFAASSSSLFARFGFLGQTGLFLGAGLGVFSLFGRTAGLFLGAALAASSSARLRSSTSRTRLSCSARRRASTSLADNSLSTTPPRAGAAGAAV
jgi:hypothetical protein